MGNKQTKQERTLDMHVVKNREYENQLIETVTQMNTQQHCPMTLSLLKSDGCWRTRKVCLHAVKSVQLTAVIRTDQVRSDIQILSFLSSPLCRLLSERGVSCWFQLNDEQLRTNDDVGRPPSRQLAVDDIVFGTLESANSFVSVCAGGKITTASSAVRYEFQFDARNIRIMQKAEDRLFDLQIEYKQMYRIVHVVLRGNRFDVYFQLRHPPLMHECVDVHAPEQHRRFSRRSYIHGFTSEEIGLCDVLRVGFGVGVHDTDLRDMFCQLPVADKFDSSGWDLRFTWIHDRTAEVASVDESKLNSFRVLYASEVLRSVGLRCRLINYLNLLRGLPDSAHADLLYDVAELYENQPEYYLIDASSVTKRWKPKPKSSEDRAELATAVLTPTRIVFRRPTSTNQSSRVLRDYFAGDRAEYAMKAHFRDEDFLQNEANNLNHIQLVSQNGSLDDEVAYCALA